jgi:hypothetical protein
MVTLQYRDLKLWLEHDLHDTNLYYRIRNMLWIKRNESGLFPSLLVASGYFYLLLRWFRPLIPALKVFQEAAMDAYSDRLGKRVD